jgi:hypothetical protein
MDDRAALSLQLAGADEDLEGALTADVLHALGEFHDEMGVWRLEIIGPLQGTTGLQIPLWNSVVRVSLRAGTAENVGDYDAADRSSAPPPEARHTA